jgi:hypothetical protein
MRIWSLHPKYLDSKGLVALWRETLLAKNVLEDKTKGYRNHPQLLRFKNSGTALDCINLYLDTIRQEAQERNYNFDKSKVNSYVPDLKLTVTAGQISYELEHLKRKLLVRDQQKLFEIENIGIIEPHPLFRIIEGDFESWEIIN